MHNYIHLDMKEFLTLYGCEEIVKDYPWVKKLTLVCNLKLKRTWGRAWNEKGDNYGTIELSSHLLMQHYGHRKEIFIHEIMHFVAAKHGDVHHGIIFKQLMEKYTGVRPKTRFYQGMFDIRGKIKKIS